MPLLKDICPSEIRGEIEDLEREYVQSNPDISLTPERDIYFVNIIKFFYDLLLNNSDLASPEVLAWIFEMHDAAPSSGNGNHTNPKRGDRQAGRGESKKREHGTPKRGRQKKQEHIKNAERKREPKKKE